MLIMHFVGVGCDAIYTNVKNKHTVSHRASNKSRRSRRKLRGFLLLALDLEDGFCGL